MQSGLDGAEGDFDRLRDLGELEAVDEAQDQDLAVILAEALEQMA